MLRTLYTDEHEAFRQTVRKFVEAEVVPAYPAWEKQGLVDREIFARLGATGALSIPIPEQYGGAGINDFRYNVVLQEEISRACVHMGPLRLMLDVVLPYFIEYANEEQAARWLPRIGAGTLLTAIGMTEPGTGSDLAGVKTTAVRDGDHYVLNGSKTFITGGALADLVIVVCRTSTDPENRRNGLSLLVVEDGMPGFEKGKNLPKIGLKVQDTVELFFNDVRVPVANLLGEEGKAFSYLGHNLPQERLTIAAGSVVASRTALEITKQYVKDRTVFGKQLAEFQNTKFELAAVATEVEAAEAFLDKALMLHFEGRLTPADAAQIKLYTTEAQQRIIDRCLQLFGGYGYITEYPIARLYADARVARIYGGTSEVMKSIISKSLGL